MPVITRQQQETKRLQDEENREFEQICNSLAYSSLDDNQKSYLTNEVDDKLLAESNYAKYEEEVAFNTYNKKREIAKEALSAYTQYKNDKIKNAAKIIGSLIQTTKTLLQKKNINNEKITNENIERLQTRFEILNCKQGDDIIRVIERKKMFKNCQVIPFDGVLYRIDPVEWYAITLITIEEVKILALAIDPSSASEKYIQLFEDRQNKQWVDVGALWWERPKDWLK